MKTNLIVVLLLIQLFLVGCGQSNSTMVETPSPEILVTASPSPTATMLPSATPALPSVWVVIPEEADSSIVEPSLSAIKSLASPAGLELKTMAVITPSDLMNEKVPLLIAFSPLPNLVDILTAYPTTRILLISTADGDVPEQVNVIQKKDAQVDTRSFLAGYIAAVVTTDYRIGLVTQAGDENSNLVKTTFKNGASYFCGLCQAVYPPYPIPGYPLFYEYSGADGDLDEVVRYFQEWQVRTIFISSPLDQNNDLLTSLSQADFKLIAERQPPEGMQANWIASIVTEDLNQAIIDLWPELINGDNVAQINLSLSVVPGNVELFSQGRQNLVNQVLQDLLKGFIDTGVSGN